MWESFNCLSVTYKNVPVEIRGQYAMSNEEQEAFITRLLQAGIVAECVILSTCNRSELYFDGEDSSIQKVQREFAAYKKLSMEQVLRYVFCYQEGSAIRHLYKVTAGMESMVLGEDEILGQVKEAFFQARKWGATGYYFNTIFQGAITCAKRIKTDTLLSKLPVSVGTLVAREVFARAKLKKQRVLIIGITGKMGTIIKKNISGREDIAITGTVRNHSEIRKVTESTVTQIDYKERYRAMEEADIVISVTTSPHYTITYEELQRAIKTRKERLFIDLSVPLDMDREIRKIDGVTLYDLDYFNAKSKENNKSKGKALNEAEELLHEYVAEIKKTLAYHEFLDHMPRLKALYESNGFEQMLYQIRDKSSSEEFTTILTALRRL